MSVDSNDIGGRIGKSAPIRIRNLIPGSLLATFHGDLNVSDPAVCFGDDVFEVNATALKSGREGGGFGATKPEESWMLPETECEFLRYLVGSDDVSYVEKYISYVEENNWFGEDYLLLTMATGKTIWKRQTKLALYKSESPEKLLNDAPNASESSKMTEDVLEERSSVSESRPLAPNGDDGDVAPLTGSRTNPYNGHHLNANEVPINEETPAHRQHDEHDVAQMQRPQNHQQQHQEQQHQEQQHQEQQHQEQQHQEQQHQYRLQQQYQQHQQQQLYQQQQQQLYQQQQQQLYQEQQQRLYQQQLYQQQQQQLYQQQQQQLYQQRLYQQQLYQQQQQQLYQQQLHQQQLHQQQHNQRQHQPHQGGIFYPPLQGRTLVYGPPPPTTVVPYLSGFICHQQPWPNSSYRPIPIQQFPQPPQPVYFVWQPINNTESPPVDTAERDHISSDHIIQTREDDQQEQNDNNDFVLDECIENIISTIETRDENGLRRFLFLLKRVHPDKLEEFNKIMGLMDFINAQLPM